MHYIRQKKSVLWNQNRIPFVYDNRLSIHLFCHIGINVICFTCIYFGTMQTNRLTGLQHVAPHCLTLHLHSWCLPRQPVASYKLNICILCQIELSGAVSDEEVKIDIIIDSQTFWTLIVTRVLIIVITWGWTWIEEGWDVLVEEEEE